MQIFIAKTCFLYLAILFFSPVVSSQTWQEYYNSIRSVEKVRSALRSIRIEFIDKRWSKEYSFDLSRLKNSITKELTNKGYKVFESSGKSLMIKPVDLQIEIVYLNFYESSAGRLFGKGILDLKLKDPYNRDQNEITVSSSIPFNDGDIDDYYDTDYSDQFFIWQDKVINQLAQRLYEKDKDYFEQSSSLKDVISFGKVPLNKENKDYEKLAVIDALQNATTKATGLKLENITTLVDFGDVTNKTTTGSTGIILDYRLLPEFTKVTADSVYCVMVEAIIKDEY